MKMRKLCATLAIAGALLCGADRSAAAESLTLTTTNLVGWCNEPNGSMHSTWCYGFLMGVFDNLIMMSVVCGDDPTGLELKLAFEGGVRNHPERLGEGRAFVVAAAFREAFPCKKQ
jgi:hypothetical protein